MPTKVHQVIFFTGTTILHEHHHNWKMVLPAESVLASTLFTIVNDQGRLRRRKCLATACSPIDDALRGGIDYGRITCISGEKGTGKTTVGEIWWWYFSAYFDAFSSPISRVNCISRYSPSYSYSVGNRSLYIWSLRIFSRLLRRKRRS